MFRDRADAGMQLADLFRDQKLTDPLVLAIPRGGVITGAVLARELGAELDVVLARKLRAPQQPEAAIGAVSELGQVYLNDIASEFPKLDDYLVKERDFQMAEIARRNQLLRGARPAAPVAGRSVIVTDDGIATGATMIAALRDIRSKRPKELIVAVPVASPAALELVRIWSDDVRCLLSPGDFWAVGHYYEDFRPVEDDEVLELIRKFRVKGEGEQYWSPSTEMQAH